MDLELSPRRRGRGYPPSANYRRRLTLGKSFIQKSMLMSQGTLIKPGRGCISSSLIVLANNVLLSLVGHQFLCAQASTPAISQQHKKVLRSAPELSYAMRKLAAGPRLCARRKRYSAARYAPSDYFVFLLPSPRMDVCCTTGPTMLEPF